jgi:hypothetical protein
MYLYKITNKNQYIFFNFKSPIFYIWRIYVIFFYVNVFLLKVRILIHGEIWHNDDIIIGMLFCEHVNVSMSRKGYPKVYFPHTIRIFCDKSIHHGKIFSNKIIRGKIFLTQFYVEEYFLTRKNLVMPTLKTMK